MRVLVVTTIFPNRLEPSNAPYNRRQLGELGKRCLVEVWAPVPWFPAARLVGTHHAACRLARLPRRWWVDGMPVWHPRVLHVPRLGRGLSGPLHALSLLPRALLRCGRIDVVLGSFAYPDGWAAVALARILGVPAVVKVHGSDVNVYGSGPLVARLRWVFRHAHAVVGPSRPLVARAVELGADGRTSRSIPNGVDLDRFRLQDRREARRGLGQPLEGELVLFVGRLEPQKGLDELLEAFRHLRRRRPRARLVLIGDGPRRRHYEEIVGELALPVHFAGARPHPEVAQWLAAADLLCLPSWAEGTPNVVLEALACGRPVVASDVGGIADVVRHPRLGRLVAPRDPAGLAEALVDVLGQEHDAVAIRRSAPLCSWPESGRMLHEVLVAACGAAEASRHPPGQFVSRSAAVVGAASRAQGAGGPGTGCASTDGAGHPGS